MEVCPLPAARREHRPGLDADVTGVPTIPWRKQVHKSWPPGQPVPGVQGAWSTAGPREPPREVSQRTQAVHVPLYRERYVCYSNKQTEKNRGEEYAKRIRGRSRYEVTRDSSVARGLLVRRSKLVLCPLPPAHSSGLAFGQCTCFQGPRVRDEHAMDLNAWSCS